MALSASRTSSSLKGLMMAMISFMRGLLFVGNSLAGSAARPPAGGAPGMRQNEREMLMVTCGPQASLTGLVPPPLFSTTYGEHFDSAMLVSLTASEVENPAIIVEKLAP